MCSTRKGFIKSGLFITGVSTFATFCILAWAGSLYNEKPGVKDNPIIMGILVAGFVGCLLCFTVRILQLLAESGRASVHPLLTSHHVLLFLQLTTQIALIWHLLVTLADSMAVFLFKRTVSNEKDEWLWVPPALDLLVFFLMFAHMFFVVVEMMKSCFEKETSESDELTHLLD